MTKFCEGCPLRGRATGELVTAGFMPVAGGHYDFLTGKPVPDTQNEIGVILDENNDPSLPIRKGVESAETLINRVEKCEGPEVAERKLLGIKLADKTICPAIGRMALKEGGLAYNLMTKEVGGY